MEIILLALLGSLFRGEGRKRRNADAWSRFKARYLAADRAA